ncbi:hypothetical protein BCR32DRAFT_249652 [Anaeromyces robustus]|uniref:CCHC-type domain-containing protein n=1 Tax=Anaeromyces robustus TaxID=1754192 RepID=A0A1Y1WP84_9FUNG|nr:hypothetical protein BCR32DRAFT_249652 [Anaeromyces robustus]|eukprot:ORX75330.1 hypothetical protein BCR32DRAFT_249652 [Anaeromyces robustus]
MFKSSARGQTMRYNNSNGYNYKGNNFNNFNNYTGTNNNNNNSSNFNNITQNNNKGKEPEMDELITRMQNLQVKICYFCKQPGHGIKDCADFAQFQQDPGYINYINSQKN